jgi:hypothetical protein
VSDFQAVCVAKSVAKLTIFSPKLFQLAGFKQWLESEDSLVFTWHRPGDEFTAWSDVLVTYEDGELMDESMPSDIADWLLEQWEKHYPQESRGYILLRNYIPNQAELAEHI